MASKLEEAQKLKEQYEAALNAAKQEFIDKIAAKKKELKELEAEYEGLYGAAPKTRRRRRTKAEIEATKSPGKAKKPGKPRAKQKVARKPAKE
jgi:hypothetical protein